jgi:hypothetical protein
MITAEERKHLDELRSRLICPKKCACIASPLTDLCKGRYHGDIDVMECLDQTKPPCKFVHLSGGMRVCTCPLRKYIAQHFSKWAAESTWLLTPEPDAAKSTEA